MSIRDKFPRTICACRDCSIHCKTCPGMLGIGDPERIMEVLDLSVIEDMLKYFDASQGALVRTEAGELAHIPTIVPTLGKYGCVFLMNDGMCSIHKVSPTGCSHLDAHTEAKKAHWIVSGLLREIIVDWRANGSYSTLWKYLAANKGVIMNRRYRRGMYVNSDSIPGRPSNPVA